MKKISILAILNIILVFGCTLKDNENDPPEKQPTSGKIGLLIKVDLTGVITYYKVIEALGLIIGRCMEFNLRIDAFGESIKTAFLEIDKDDSSALDAAFIDSGVSLKQYVSGYLILDYYFTGPPLIENLKPGTYTLLLNHCKPDGITTPFIQQYRTSSDDPGEFNEYLANEFPLEISCVTGIGINPIIVEAGKTTWVSGITITLQEKE